MFPIINIGPAAIQSAGIILLLTFWLGISLTAKFARSIQANAEVIENSLMLGLLTGIFGARIGFFLQNPGVFTENPLSLFSLTPSMLDESFGLLVGVLTVIIFAQKKHIPLWPTLDSLTPFMLMLVAGVQLANFANGSAFGLATNLPWGIYLWGASRHPVQLYALILILLFFGWFYRFTNSFKKTGMEKSGFLFFAVTAALGTTTLFTQSFTAQSPQFASIDLWQMTGWIILVVSLIGVYFRKYRTYKNKQVLVGLGSNYQPDINLPAAKNALENFCRFTRFSSIYLTEDISKKSEDKTYQNQVVEIRTQLSYQDLVEKLKTIEKDLGRIPGNKTAVPIDLDVLTYGDEVFDTNSHPIPNPSLTRFRFVVVPVQELVPDFRHPANGKDIDQIVKELDDTSGVRRKQEVKDESAR